MSFPSEEKTMRARLPKITAALCATIALGAAPVAALAPVVTASAEVTVPGHWYDTPPL